MDELIGGIIGLAFVAGCAICGWLFFSSTGIYVGSERFYDIDQKAGLAPGSRRLSGRKCSYFTPFEIFERNIDTEMCPRTVSFGGQR